MKNISRIWCFATRYPENYGLSELKNYISFGASPRASINLAIASRAYAFLKGRAFVIPEDVKALAKDVLRHRMGLTFEAEAEEITTEEIINRILAKIRGTIMSDVVVKKKLFWKTVLPCLI